MASQPFRYLAADFSAQREALIQRVQGRYPGVWNSFLVSSFGALIINLVAWCFTTLAYTLNFTAGQNFVSVMTLRESAVRLGNNVGYALANPFPSTLYCSAVLASPAPADVSLAAGTPVRTSDAAATPFELSSDYVIPTGAMFPQSVVVTFDPSQSGPIIVPALVSVTNGSVYADCLDDSVDLRQYVLGGQYFSADDGETTYLIDSVTQAPGAPSYNRMVLNSVWASPSGSVTGQVFERRIAFIQGTSQEEVFVPASGANFVATLSRQPVIDGSVEVAVNGIAWSAGTLATADMDAQVYQTRNLPTGPTVVMFGNGSLGVAPPNGATITVNYRTGGGAFGNVGSNAVNTTITGVVTSIQSPITVQVTNGQPASGGADQESRQTASQAIPAWTQANGRAVTESDYEALSVAFRSPLGVVKFASASFSVQNPLLEGNLVDVYAWTTAADGSLTPIAGALKATLGTYLQSVSVGTAYVVMADGVTQALPFACLVSVAPGYDPATIAAQAGDAAIAYVDSLAPGSPVVYSDLLSAVTTVPGVQSANLSAPASDLNPGAPNIAFVPPPDGAPFLVPLSAEVGGALTGILEYPPRAAWALSATLGSAPLSVSPDVQAGLLSLSGPGLDPTHDSTVNLFTGAVQLWPEGPVGDFIIAYSGSVAYSSVQSINLYVGYGGDQSQATRRAVRQALRSWVQGLAPGEPVYSVAPALASPPTSLTEVVAAVPNVGTVTLVAFNSPTNPSQQVTPGQYVLPQLGQVIINGQVD